MKRKTDLILFLLILAVPALAHSATSATGTSEEEKPEESIWNQLQLRPELTFSFVNPAEFNSATNLLGANQSMRLFGAPGFAVNADYPVISWLSVGMKLDYLRAASGDVATSTVAYNTALNALVPYASVTTHQPLSDGWTVGASAGLGVPALYWVTIQSASEDAGATGTNTYAANPISAFGTIYAEYQWNERFQFRGELGNRFLMASQMKATADGPLGVHQGDALKGPDGKVIPVNASSPYFGLGVTMHL